MDIIRYIHTDMSALTVLAISVAPVVVLALIVVGARLVSRLGD